MAYKVDQMDPIEMEVTIRYGRTKILSIAYDSSLPIKDGDVEGYVGYLDSNTGVPLPITVSNNIIGVMFSWDILKDLFVEDKELIADLVWPNNHNEWIARFFLHIIDDEADEDVDSSKGFLDDKNKKPD